MTSVDPPVGPLTPEGLERRLRALAEAAFGEFHVDDLEMRHLLEIVRRASLLLNQGYDPVTLDRILSGERPPARLLESSLTRPGGSPEQRLARLLGVPDILKTYGDKCLYDVGLAGRRRFRGIDLEDLGPRSYSLASQALHLLADDRQLRDYFEANRMGRLPLQEEILFLRQCAARFQLYSQILQAFRGDEPVRAGPSGPGAARAVAAPMTAAPAPAAPPPAPVGPGAGIRLTRAEEPGTSGPAPGPGDDEVRGLDREERLTHYERALLFSSLNVASLRRALKRDVVDQAEAVDQLCDDLGVYALGTRARPRPQSYLLVGPTGVGKNHLIETLVRRLEEAWGVEVPFLVIEGPQYTYPSDVNELKGSTRGFIRSDEEGLLAEFHRRARAAPLSVLLVDEIEKAHPQLARFFLALMDRGFTMDNRGRLLRFPATLLAYTSNLGYSDEQMAGRPIGYGARRTPSGRRRSAARDLGRALPPEFLNRLRVIHFAPLSRDSAARILDQEIERIAARYRSWLGTTLTVTSAARAAIVGRGFDEESGARRLVGEADRICNVEVSLRLNAGATSLSESGRRLLERIRQARQGARAVDERAIRAELARQKQGRLGGARVTVDFDGTRFAYRVEPA
jgi:MoxR-like ATPase